MRHGWQVAALGVAVAATAMTAGCEQPARTAGSHQEAASDGTTSSPSAAQPAATSAPGTYGVPADPALPNPTDVATDSPVPAPPAQGADVVITYAGWTDATVGLEVGAYVTGVAESGGVCTLTLTSGSRTVSAQAAGEPDSSSTSCVNLSVPGRQLPSGTWTAVVSYVSSSTSGHSDSHVVVVP